MAGSLDFADFVRQRSAPMLRTAWLLTGGDWALAEISTERFVVSPATTGGFATVDSREVLRHALRQLTAKQRAVITLRYFEDRSEAETAVIMGCSVGTVKSQASRAIAKLRKHPGIADVMTGGK